MSFWSIFFFIFIGYIGIWLNISNIYLYHKDNNIKKPVKWFIYVMSTICSIALALFITQYISISFDKCVKTAYYNGVSVKTIPKLKSDYTIEKVDSVFYINKMRE